MAAAVAIAPELLARNVFTQGEARPGAAETAYRLRPDKRAVARPS
jgi:hypothetical protein